MTAQAARKFRRRFHRVTGGQVRGLRTLVAAFFRLDLIEQFSYPLPFVLSEVGVIFPIIFYFFIGQLVVGSEASDFVGGDYFTFSAIGIVVSLIMASALGGFGRALQRSQNRGQFELLLAGPVRWIFLPAAMNSWRSFLGLINGTLTLLVAVALGASIIVSGIPEFVVLLILGVGASTAVGLLAASLMVVAKRSQPVLTLYGLASSLLGGALFSIDQLPEWLRWLSFAIPHTYVINSARAVLMDDPGTFFIPFGTAVIVLSLFNVVVLSLGLWLFGRSLQFARRESILGGY